MNYALSYLEELESEAVYVIREAVAQLERPVLLFSGGKDSLVLAHLAAKAFRPARIPFPFLHVDTGHNFPETLSFRDGLVARMGVKLIVREVAETIARGRASEESGPHASRNAQQSVTLLDAIEEFKFDAAFGGARRDEEKARAKERFFSLRDEFGQWDPRRQRPELWGLFNGRKRIGEHFRVFPLSNWTELDIWRYIEAQKLEIPSLYFAHTRACVRRDGMLLAHSPHVPLRPQEKIEELFVRFRTVGDVTCTGALLSQARTVEEIVAEVSSLRVTERGGRADDRRSETAMEDRKRRGYF